jgi:predicted Co/Zn/Cd cation transporter (cation efflux family)
MGLRPDLTDERAVLKLSIAATLAVAAFGVTFGLLSGSFSIMFDGAYSLVDACMSLLSLAVVNLITGFARSEGLSRRLRERFSFGFWHLEPMVLGLNGVMLIGVAVYALINAVSSLLEGGRDLEFGWAMAYAAIVAVVCFGVATVEARANRRIGSDFLRLDMQGWLMSGGITLALLIAFGLGLAVQGTGLAWITPYVDPAVLALVCLVIIPIPIGAVRQALSDILLVAPADLRVEVDEAARAFVAAHGFVTYRAYAARIGRSRQIELYFIVPPDAPARTIAEWDALREEIAQTLGDASADRWLTVVFTGDLRWAD